MKINHVFWALIATVIMGAIGVVSMTKTSSSEPNPPKVVTTELPEIVIPEVVVVKEMAKTDSTADLGRSVIVEAIELKEFRRSMNATLDSLDVNVQCSSANHSQCLAFIERMRRNSGLHDALRYAKDLGISVFVDKEFNVGFGWVDVNISATDDEIIEFLMGKAP